MSAFGFFSLAYQAEKMQRVKEMKPTLGWSKQKPLWLKTLK